MGFQPGHLHRLDSGSLFFQQPGQTAVGTGAGQQHPAAKEGPVFKPVELLAQSHRRADGDEGGAFQPQPVCLGGDGVQSAPGGALGGQSGPGDDGGGGVAGLAGLQQPPGYLLQPGQAHEQHQSVVGAGQLGKIQPAEAVGQVVGGVDPKSPGDAPVGDGDTRGGQPGHRAGDARHHLKGHPLFF